MDCIDVLLVMNIMDCLGVIPVNRLSDLLVVKMDIFPREVVVVGNTSLAIVDGSSIR